MEHKLLCAQTDITNILRAPKWPAGGVDLSPKNSDLVTYYEHVATIHHARGYTFVAFRMTMDALYAMQKDPQRFPAWLMKSQIKQTELRVYFAVVKTPPTPGARSIYEWLAPIEDAFPGAEEWMYDSLAYFITTKGILTAAKKLKPTSTGSSLYDGRREYSNPVEE